MSVRTIVLFGEAEKGAYKTAYLCRTLCDLVDYLGEPPKDSLGLHYAVQSLLYRQNLVFVRVREEGFAVDDYLEGLELLANQTVIPSIHALFLPGVGDARILSATYPICLLYHSLLIMTEKDLYDYLTLRAGSAG